MVHKAALELSASQTAFINSVVVGLESFRILSGARTTVLKPR